MNRMTIPTPATSPPAKSFPMDWPVIMPITIRVMLGGIRIPRVPAEPIDPKMMDSLYLRCRIGGIATSPVVTVDAEQLPVMAESAAANPQVPTASPPRRRPDQR